MMSWLTDQVGIVADPATAAAAAATAATDLSLHTPIAHA